MQYTLVGRKATTPSTTVATTVATPRKAETAAAEATTTTTHATSAAAAAHAGKVRSLRDHLDVAALKDTLVQNQSLWDKVGLSKLDVGVTVNKANVSMCYHRSHSGVPLTLWAAP